MFPHRSPAMMAIVSEDTETFIVGVDAPRGIDLVAQSGGVLLRDESAERHFGEAGIGVVALEVVVGELLCLDQEVPVLR